MAWAGPVHSIRKSEDSIVKEGLCFVTSHNVLKSFCKKENGPVPIADYFEVAVNLNKTKCVLKCLSVIRDALTYFDYLFS